MQLLLVGISHRTAPVELRERVDFQARGVAEALRALAQRGSAREAVLVSTCNRAELYVACDEAAAARQDLVRFVSDFNGIAAADVAPHVYDVTDLDVARHLFRVAAGLDSLVMGEPQILGQVKEAHTIATDAHTSGPVLNRLFHSSFAVGKRVRTETGLGSGAVSISYAAVALAPPIASAVRAACAIVRLTIVMRFRAWDFMCSAVSLPISPAPITTTLRPRRSPKIFRASEAAA